VIGDIPLLESISLCQEACIAVEECAYFSYDYEVKDCQLFDNADRTCDFQVGPATPSFEDCQISPN
jgi:hypothetical protein